VNDLIDNNTGKAFPPPAVFAGYIFLVLSPVAIYSNPFVGLLLALAGGFVSFTSTGVQIDPSKRKFREYTSYFGVKKGLWQTLDKYPFLAIMGRTQSYTTYSRGQVALTDREKFIDICLLSKSHRQNVMIKRLRDRDQATKDAKELAEKLNLELTKYNPPVSKKTQAKHR